MPYTSRHFIVWVIIILHLAGALATVIPNLKEWIQPLTPVNLLICSLLLISYRQERGRNFIIFFILTIAIGFSIEVLGVNTGYPFGTYWYGTTLGWKVFGVPVIIALNWFMLSYAFGTTLNRWKFISSLKVLLASLAMVALDILIEPVAITLNYWNWESSTIPIQNYISWFLIAAIIQVLFQHFLPKEKNDLSIPLIFSQVFYFVFIYIFSKF
ncbi:MAG: carotenoid biosynthesis protein [Marinoscillum sp.]